MSAAENKNVVLSLFESLSAGRLDDALALLADSATWWVAGNPAQFALAGTRTKVQFAEMLAVIGAAMPNGVTVTVTGLTAEGDRVAAEAETHGESATGKAYHNLFHNLFEVHDGKIQSAREYLDTIHANDVLVDR
jgi:ketosteroid isomerase-like protein